MLYSKKINFLLIVLLFFYKAIESQVVINEYSCSNISTKMDSYGEYEDWIELYNSGVSAVNLTGYYLSDNKNNPTNWKIPSGNIAPGQYILIYASGRSLVAGNDIHPDFKLTQTKPEEIIFADAGGTILDSLTLNPTQENHSRGRTTDGASTWALFTTPTPGAANTNAKNNYATKPTMSIGAGFYTSAQSVAITSPDANVAIHYTLNGNIPTSSDPVYATPISISSTTVVRARAFSSNPNVPASFIESNTLFINSSHTVPVISLFGDNILTLMGGSQIDPETSLEYFNASGVMKSETSGKSNKHGNDSWAYSQRGIDFISYDQFGYNHALRDQIFSTTPRKSFQRIILKAAANDNYPFETGGAHIRDAYIAHLSQLGNLNVDERSWAPCVLYVNAQYWGVYEIREKYDDKDYCEYYYDVKEDSLQFLKTWGGTWSEYGGPQAQTDWNSLKNFINSNNLAVQANYDYVDSLLNIKSFTDYFIINTFVVCMDWLNWNTAWWRGLNYESDKKKWRYTLWDMDATFGHYINYTGIPDESANAKPCDVQSIGDPGGQGHVDILNKLMQNQGYKTYYLNRYNDLLNTTFSCGNMITVLDNMINQISPEMPKQIAKWGGSMSGWQANVNALKTFINQRCVNVKNGFATCYNVTGPHNLVIDVQPANSGTVDLNDLTLPYYPYTISYFGGLKIDLKATPASGFRFEQWEMSAHTANPSATDKVIDITVAAPDNIVARFDNEQDYLPLAFSPNGDGINDVLIINGKDLKEVDLKIYSRWGQLIFETKDQTKGWDGKVNGQLVNTDVFAYRLRVVLSNGDEVVKKGNLTLMR
ncbi:MAG: CotH kinase family protein [Bacteroidetes bacterium]|nr:CotH kinase family protein [Bacteroidota bacterium]